jgi:hypothetical protein
MLECSRLTIDTQHIRNAEIERRAQPCTEPAPNVEQTRGTNDF